MKTFKGFMNEEYKRACLMCTVMPWGPIRQIQSMIPKEDFDEKETSENGDVERGYQGFLHLTVLYGMNDDDNLDKIRGLINKDEKMTLMASSIDHFYTEDNTVAVLRIVSNDIVGLHYNIRDNFDVNLIYPDYKPHITLGFLKKGKELKHKITPFQLQIKEFIFSKTDGTHIKL